MNEDRYIVYCRPRGKTPNYEQILAGNSEEFALIWVEEFPEDIVMFVEA